MRSSVSTSALCAWRGVTPRPVSLQTFQHRIEEAAGQGEHVALAGLDVLHLGLGPKARDALLLLAAAHALAVADDAHALVALV